MARFVKFETQVVACYNHNTEELEFLPVMPNGISASSNGMSNDSVYINPDKVEYVIPVNDGEVTCVYFGSRDSEDYVFLAQRIDSVVHALEEASRQ